MLPFHMLVALPTHPSPRLYPFAPLFSSLFSVTSVPSALKSARSPIAEFHRAAQPPNHFPLFPHPVNIEHAGTPANPSPSIIYFTTSVYPGGGTSTYSHARHCRSMPCPKPAAALSITPLNATLTKKQGAPPRQPCTAPPRYSLLTTHYSPSPTIRYTMASRHT
jgi:hypothetical protein